tara:strand:- start:2563 stop:3306 length:744 start_codon:yes stop_codon:yes gene_type:complete
MNTKTAALFSILALSSANIFAQPMTNKDVIELIGIGMDDAVVISKIQNSQADFDTSTKALKRLKDAGVSSDVMTAIISADANAGPSGDASRITLVQGGNTLELNQVRVRAEESRRKKWIPVYGKFAKKETFLFVSGITADNEIANGDLSFNAAMEPNRVRLVELGKHKKRERFVVFTKGATDREIGLSAKKLSDGTFEYTPKTALDSGEYALLVSPDGTNITNGNALVQYALNTSMYGISAYDFKVR